MKCLPPEYFHQINVFLIILSTFSIYQVNSEGLSECENRQCDRTVGFGGSPDENGETTLDSLLIDGPGHRTGAVAALRHVKSAARVAWTVMNYTEHSLLVGEKATKFAQSMGFKLKSLLTPESKEMHEQWLEKKCQPNFWKNVFPDSTSSCGPYKPKWKPVDHSTTHSFNEGNHDTIGMILVDENGNVAAGTSSNGARNKIPGRVGDSPIVGAGAYVDNSVGGAAATGDGDVMMRFVPSFLVVELMRQGKSPTEATSEAILRIKRFYPNFFGAIIATDINGNFGAACSGMEKFHYSVVRSDSEERREREVEVVEAICENIG
uniref:N(4)-(beta-N-acetylglucosaminyl)-L-asparaginase n=1 Tax=Meloidogyne hapla TaxID=6305 RepID=A0A1I8BVF6_MELHA